MGGGSWGEENDESLRTTSIESFHSYYLFKTKTPKCLLDYRRKIINIKANTLISLPKKKKNLSKQGHLTEDLREMFYTKQLLDEVQAALESIKEVCWSGMGFSGRNQHGKEAPHSTISHPPCR